MRYPESMSRTEILYDYITTVCRGEVSEEKIAGDLYPICPAVKEGITFHDSTARKMISDDIQKINSDPAFEKIIVSSAGTCGVKVANKEEALSFIQKQQMACFKKLKRLAVLTDKVMKQGQINTEGEVYGV